MNKLEQKYVDEVNAYLALPVAEREIEKGAMLMLKGNRNQTLHKNVIRKIWHEKVEYELKKILGNRLIVPEKEKDSEDVKVVAPLKTVSITEIDTVVSNHLNKATEIEVKGKRADHDQLPEAIQLIPEENKARYQQMRSLHEKLKLMNAENFTAEDRKPVLDEFTKLDGDLRLSWDKYDTFVIGQPDNEVIKVIEIDAKRIQSNRTYFSRLMKKETLTEEVLAETQSRYDEMQANKIVVSPEITEKLKAFGVKVEEKAPEAEETKAPEAENTEVDDQKKVDDSTVTNTEETNAPEAKKPENTDIDEQTKAEAVILSSIEGMLKSNLSVDVIKTAFSNMGKVGEKDLTPEFLQELIDSAISKLAEEDVNPEA